MRGQIASVQRHCIRRADRFWDGRECGFGFLSVVGVIGKRTPHDQQTPLIYRNLCVVVLLKASICWVFHDTRVWIGEIVLVARACSWRRWCWRATTGTPPRHTLPLLALCYLGVILCLLGCGALLRTSLQHLFGHGQTLQTVFSLCNLLAHHQSVRHLWLLVLFAEGKQFLDLSS